ncbi:MAG: RagB/SusD family nutrient uptake outer membrane protein, partial [Bacteroidota bacterium]
MKKLLLFSTICFVVFTTTSCKKFLDEKPVSEGIATESTDSVKYKSASDVEAALAGVYSGFKNEYFELDYYVNGDAQSDDCYAGADNPANFQIDDYKIDATNSNVSRDWAYLYSIIGNANSVINNVDKVTDPALTAERKKEMIGEASFIRAFMYFQLVQLWGDVPLQLKEVGTISARILPEIYPILFPPRAPSAEVYTQIIADLNTALVNVKATATNKGYVTTGAVNALLAKVYATQPTRDWSKVKQYCDAVIAGGYTLLPDYHMLWDNLHKNSAESIFEINYTGGSTDGNWGASMF